MTPSPDNQDSTWKNIHTNEIPVIVKNSSQKILSADCWPTVCHLLASDTCPNWFFFTIAKIPPIPLHITVFVHTSLKTFWLSIPSNSPWAGYGYFLEQFCMWMISYELPRWNMTVVKSNCFGLDASLSFSSSCIVLLTVVGRTLCIFYLYLSFKQT